MNDEKDNGIGTGPGAKGFRNQRVAERLREAAELLEHQQANPFRVAAYRRAAGTVAGLNEDVAVLLEREGIEGLDALPGIGPTLAPAIAQMVRTGRWAQLERLRGAVAPEELFQSIPGLGPELARRIHEDLDVDTLETLELTAHDGRLEQVPGIGPRGRRCCARRLPRRSRAPVRPASGARSSARSICSWMSTASTGRSSSATLCQKSRRDASILRARRGCRSCTPSVMTGSSRRCSPTPRAHELGQTADWVVLYFSKHNQPEGQRTVVRETRGALAGHRVVRGREAECLAKPDLMQAGGARGG